MATPFSKSSFASGELAPGLWGRIDLAKYAIGTSTMRNFFVNYKGGASTRAGTKYVGASGQVGTAVAPRLITFQFNLNQGYALEFGDHYMRVIFQGAYVLTGLGAIYSLTTPWAAADIQWLKHTQSADVMTLCCVNQTTMTEYPPYDLARIAANNWTLTETTFAATLAAPNAPTVVAQSSGVATTYYSYVVTAYNSNTGEESIASLPTGVQNNDIALTSGSNTISWNAVPNATSYNVYASTPSYGTLVPVSSLYGFIGTALGTSFSDQNITPDFTRVPPQHTNPFARGSIVDVLPTAAGINYSQQTVGYIVTTSTGTGFSGAPVVTNGGISGFVIYDEGQNYQPVDTIAFTDSGGGLATGQATFTANPADTNSMELGGIFIHFATAPAPAPNAGGQFIYSEIENTTALTVQTLANNLNASNILSYSVATYTASGNVLTITYKTPGTVGNAYTMSTVSAPATFSGTTLAGGGTVGSGATANLVVGAETGTYPGGAAYFQQRRYYFNTLDQPDTYFASKPGIYNNMDSSIPVTDSDALTGTPWAQQINGIQAMVPMPGGNIILTGNGAWQLSGGGATQAVTPSNQVATPQAYNGCNATVAPIPIDYDVLYVQAKGSIVRDLTYNFFVNIYTGNDKTQLSSHLFTGYEIVQWAYSEEPYKIVWAVRNDGVLLSMTYLKAEDVYGWARHDTNGLFVGICSVTEPPVDATYVIVQRYINGAWVYYVERMDDRLWTVSEDAWCVDAGLSYPQNEPNATLTVSPAVWTLQNPAIVTGGQNYSANTYATISDPIGTGAICTLTIVGGAVTSAVLSGTLTGYTRPSITVIDPTLIGGNCTIDISSLNLATATASASVFTGAAGFGAAGDILRAAGGIATVQSSTATSLQVAVTQPFTAVLQDNPAQVPIPQTVGNWSIINPVSTVTGLDHLDGQIVSILADGGVCPQQTVVSGSITLPNPASQIIIGLPYICQLQTLYLDIPGSNPTVQGRRKMLQGVTLRTDSSRGIYVGVNQPDASAQPGLVNVAWVGMVPVQEMTPFVLPGQPIPLVTGDTYTHFPTDWEAKGQMAFQVTDPLPLNLTLLAAELTLGDDPGP